MDEQKELREKIAAFLYAHPKAVFATVDEKGMPHTSLMLYVIDDDLNVYFGTRKAFNKYQQLLDRPCIAMSVIEETIDPLKAVDMHGEAHALTDEETKERFQYFKEHNPSIYYVEAAEDYVMFKIVPTGMRYLDATSGELHIDILELDSGTV